MTLTSTLGESIMFDTSCFVITFFNHRVRSPIDGRSLEGVPSVRVHNSTDYASNKFLIRWTEVFFIQNQETVKR